MAKKDVPREYPRGRWTKEAIRVLEERYLTKDTKGRVIETPEGMCYRVAQRIASAERKFSTNQQEVEKLTKEFYQLMVERLFLPNSPTLMNAGRDDQLQYSACFVLPVGDSLVGIFDAIKYAALIHKSGGGTGFSFSSLRPRGSVVHSTRGIASGPVSFMRVFDAATAEVKQGGMRRGANMGVLRVDHPDILEFIECKVKGGITNFNISVAATEEFMQAVKKDGSYWVYDPYLKRRIKKLKAQEVFEKIVQMAWQTGDPGMLFIDRINAGPANPVPSMGPIEATNPCGEQPLYSNEACNLGSINLSLMVKDGKKLEVDWEKLAEVTRLATRFLDDVIEANPYPLPEIDKMAKLNRRVGLGVMGWADLLFRLEIPYDSSWAIKLARKIMKFIQKKAHQESRELAKKRGPFPNFKASIYSKIAKSSGVSPRMKRYSKHAEGVHKADQNTTLRNATLTTIAPTGSISIIANCSSGIEPVFALAYRHKANDRELTFFNEYFAAAAKKHRLDKKTIEAVKSKGNLAGLKTPLKLKRVFVTAHEIGWKSHIDIQAAFQQGVDNAVSKTINLPHRATIDEVRRAYLHAYKEGCLGITVYRDGCKDQQVLYAGKEEVVGVKPRPAVVTGKTYRIETPVGTAFVTINVNGESEPLEVFVNVGKAGSDITADAQAIGRLISLILRLGSDFPPEQVLGQIVGQLEGIAGGESIGFGKNKIRSLADGIAKVLKEHLGGKQIAVGQVSEQPGLLLNYKRRDLCPACGRATLVYEEGCAKCLYCGYNKC